MTSSAQTDVLPDSAVYKPLSTPAQDSLTIATVNVNGIRAAAKVRNEDNHGIVPWLESTHADVVALQEVRADEEQTQKALAPALEAGWHLVQAPSSLKGRAGVGILARCALSDVRVGFSSSTPSGMPKAAVDAAQEFDDSGRFISAVVETASGPVRVASLYLPSGSEGTEKQDEKYRFLDAFGQYLDAYAAAVERGDELEMVVCGDWNICHDRADIKNWRTNRKKSGFLPDERAFLDYLVGVFPREQSQVGDQLDSGRNGNPAGAPGEFYGAVDYVPGSAARARVAAGASNQPAWSDVFRHVCPDELGPFSWWTWRGQAFNNDAGWRIDLQVATAGLTARARAAANASVDKAASVEQRWSDHSPVLIEYAAG